MHNYYKARKVNRDKDQRETGRPITHKARKVNRDKDQKETGRPVTHLESSYKWRETHRSSWCRSTCLSRGSPRRIPPEAHRHIRVRVYRHHFTIATMLLLPSPMQLNFHDSNLTCSFTKLEYPHTAKKRRLLVAPTGLGRPLGPSRTRTYATDRTKKS